MARPKKPEQEQRTKRLPHVRCTEAEYRSAMAQANAAKKSLSAFVRELATTGHVVAANDAQPSMLSATDVALLDQLRRIGTNINQLTRVAHATGGELPKSLVDAGEDLQEILDQLIEKIAFE